MPRVLLLIPTSTYRAGDFLAAAERLGLDVAVASEQGQPLDAFPERSLRASFRDPAAGAETIARYADGHPMDAVLAVDDGGALLAARASELLRLPGNPPAAVAATRNKAELRRLLSEESARPPGAASTEARGLASPAYRLCRFNEEAAAIARELAFPVVVKPLSLAGSRGVMRADDAAAFVAAVERLGRLLARPAVAAECGETASQYLVEGYIPGDEIALEGLLRKGSLHVLAIFDKPDPLEGPTFEETIYVTPSRLGAERQRQAWAVAERALGALGIRMGPVHVEMRLNAEGLWPIDIAARTIGGHCARALRFGAAEGLGSGEGASLEEIVLRQAAGLPLEGLEREEAASGVMMIPTPGPGRLLAVTGLEAARAVPQVTEVVLSLPLGSLLVPLPEGGAYPGFIFARAERPETVEAALRAAHACLRFELEPVPPED